MSDPYTDVQRACEQRLADADDVLWAQECDEDPPEGVELAGPYCGCSTCLVREVLDAARPYFADLARAEGQLAS